MKKEKSLNYLNSKWLMVTLFALGISLFSSFEIVAQTPTTFGDDIAVMTQVRDSHLIGTAKYDIAQAALDYLVLLDQAASANPNYLNDFYDQSGVSPLEAAPIRRAQPGILAPYTAAEIANFQSKLASDSSNPVSVERLQWILEANAY